MADGQRIDDLRRRVQKDPASIAFAQLAEELRRAGQFEESIQTCRAGLNIHPGYLSARVTLGRALLEVDQLEAAQAELELVLKSAPENLAAIRGLAEIFHRQGMLTEALAQYRAALALAKNDPDLQQTVAELAKEVEPQKPAVAADGLSFAQMQDELLKLGPPSAQADADRESGFGIRDSDGMRESDGIRDSGGEPDSNVQSESTSSESQIPNPDVLRARATIAALEHWLDAIHVSRAQLRA